MEKIVWFTQEVVEETLRGLPFVNCTVPATSATLSANTKGVQAMVPLSTVLAGAMYWFILLATGATNY